MFDRLFPEKLDENALVEKAKTSDYYFGRLFDAYSQRVYRFVRRRVQNDADAEDLVSEVFMTVAAKIRTFDTTSWIKFTSRLFGIAYNKLLNYFRDEAPAYQEMMYDTEEVQQQEILTDFAALFTQRHLYEKIVAFVQSLAQKQSSIFFLRFVEGYHNNEIASMLNIHEKTVSSTIYVVCQKVKDHVGSDI